MVSGLNMGVISKDSGIHPSSHIEIYDTSPTHLINPTFKASQLATIARQIGDADFGTIALIESELGNTESSRPESKVIPVSSLAVTHASLAGLGSRGL